MINASLMHIIEFFYIISFISVSVPVSAGMKCPRIKWA